MKFSPLAKSLTTALITATVITAGGVTPALATDNVNSPTQQIVTTGPLLSIDQKIFRGVDGKLYTAYTYDSTGKIVVEKYKSLEEMRIKALPEIIPQNPCTTSVLGAAILALGSATFAVLAANPAGAIIAGVALTSAELAAIASLLAAGVSIQSILSAISCGNN